MNQNFLDYYQQELKFFGILPKNLPMSIHKSPNDLAWLRQKLKTPMLNGLSKL